MIWRQKMNFAIRVRGEMVTVKGFKFKIPIFVRLCESSLFMEEVTHSLDFFSNKEDRSVIPMALLNAMSGLRIDTSTMS